MSLKGERVTVSVIKADVGSIGGHTRPSPEMIDMANDILTKEIGGLIIDGLITYVGDDIELIMSHIHGQDSREIHGLAKKVFLAATEMARRLGNYAAGQDLLTDAPSGNLKGAGPGVAEITFTLLPEYRLAEAFLVFMADKCGPGAFNLPFYLTFADPMHNGGLLLNPKMNMGFRVVVMDMEAKEIDRVITLRLPQDIWDLAALLHDTNRFAIESVFSVAHESEGEQILSASVTRLHNIKGVYVGKDDPCAIVRVQGLFPAPEEVLEPWATVRQITTGGARGSHNMPIMPVPVETAVTGPYCIPLVSCLAFSMDEDGSFAGNRVDMFDNQSWDWVRLKAQEKAVDFRTQGFFGITMAAQEELAYTGLQKVAKKLESRFEDRLRN